MISAEALALAMTDDDNRIHDFCWGLLLGVCLTLGAFFAVAEPIVR